MAKHIFSSAAPPLSLSLRSTNGPTTHQSLSLTLLRKVVLSHSIRALHILDYPTKTLSDCHSGPQMVQVLVIDTLKYYKQGGKASWHLVIQYEHFTLKNTQF